MTWEENNYLIHYGIKGQKKGHRRFQNEDGSYTPEGKIRYGIGDGERRHGRKDDPTGEGGKRQKRELTPEERAARNKKVKKILAITAGVTLAAAAGYMAYRIGDQWTSNLVDEYKSQAKDSEDTWNILGERHNYNRRRELDNAKMIKDRLNRKGKHYIGKGRDLRGLHNAVSEARISAHYQGLARREADYYSKLGKNVTRLEAVRNYLKNQGSIVIPSRYL